MKPHGPNYTPQDAHIGGEREREREREKEREREREIIPCKQITETRVLIS